MIYQEDVMLYFDRISCQLRDENIPIFNNVIMDYPEFPSKEDRRSRDEGSDEESEDEDH